MEETQQLNDIVHNAKSYIDARLKLTALQAAGKGSRALAVLITYVVFSFFILSSCIFGSFALAFHLGDEGQSPSLGFLLVALAYLILALLILAAKKRWLLPRLTNLFIRIFLNPDPHEPKQA
jgi:hypothetical protein